MRKNIEKDNSKLIENVGIVIFILIAVVAFAFNVIIKANDELWNFSNIYKMYNGETIYKDCNVIITPLFFYIGEMLFKLFSPNYLTFRVYNLIIYTIFYFLIYKLFRKLEIPKLNSLTYLMIILIFSIRLIPIGANYNMMALTFVLVGVLYNLKSNKTKFDAIIQGIILFFVFMTKQSIGILYMLGLIILDCITQKRIKNITKEMLKKIIVFISLLCIYCIWLVINNNLYNFFNYTILGLLEFNESNKEVDLYFIYWIFEMFLAIGILYALNKKIKIDETIKNRITVLLAFSIPIMFNAYPIFNKVHIILSSIFLTITLIYFIDKILLDELLENNIIKKICKGFNIVCIMFFVAICILINVPYIKNINKGAFIPYYGGILENEESIKKVIQYIQDEQKKGKYVKFISYKANLYNNILKINNGKIDLPFYGNLGKEGVNGLIEEIENMKNTNILIGKEGSKYQEPTVVIEYIKNNYKKIGEIEEFEICKIGY